MLHTILQTIYILLQVYWYIYLAYILLSYFNLSEDNILVRIVKGMCEPLYRFFMRILPPIHIGMIDLSPLYVFAFLQILQIILQRLIQMYP